jgi:[calcium/calmodulin-dependent protein kinase] kinase
MSFTLFRTNKVQMNAVRKFKGLLRHRRPDLFEGVLGLGNKIVQPPLSMSKSELQKHKQAQKDQSERPTVEPLQREKAHSDDQHDRQATEQAFAVEGVHHKIDLDSLHKPETERGDGVVRFSKVDKVYQPSPKRALNAHPKDHQSHETMQSPTHGKGQAHDPLEEFLFLQVGPAGDKGPPDPPAVSESPPAADVDIYETAYHEEIERIRQNSGSSAPKLYLTRRLDEIKKYLQDEQLIGPNRKQINSDSGFMKLVQGARDKARKEKDDGPEDHVVGDNGEESSKLANLVHKAVETTKDAAQAAHTDVKGAMERMSSVGSGITGGGADTLAGREE